MLPHPRQRRWSTDAPGQLALYPVVPLEWHGWTPGDLVERLHAGLVDALAATEVRAERRPCRHGLWGASGQLVHFGLAVRGWTSRGAVYIQVAPPLPLARHIGSDPVDRTPLGSLSAEGGRAVRMSRLRARIVRAVAESLGCERYHVYTGHAYLDHVDRHGRWRARAS